ncbi:MAG: ATP-binding protein [Candidatus Delongbacteria bacterium]|nr:ATP-binding protein [Candidatus Delongbacteria bacterium]MBN2833545.1 ATP-binding protein [Candidatus Delongbacteria bacterium]
MGNYKNIFSSTFPSMLDQVEKTCESMMQKLEELFGCPLKKSFDLKLLFFESMNNAIIHGNKNDNNKLVKVDLLISDKYLLFKVKDEGVGFNWKERINSISDVNNQDGRGFEIFKIYADKIEYNEDGTSLSIYVKIN